MFNHALLMNKPASGGGLPTISNDYEASSSQYLSMADSDFGAFDRAKFAISMWVKREEVGAGTYGLVSQGMATAGQRALSIFYDADQLVFGVSTDGNTFRSGELRTNATYTSTANWYHILLWYDSANATAGNRMRMWVDGSEVTSFATDTNPSAAIFNSNQPMFIGNYLSNYYDGLMYQFAFFSGTLPDISTLYDAGSPLSVVGLTGLYSYLDGAGGSVVSDGVLSADWTNNNTVTSSATIPT